MKSRIRDMLQKLGAQHWLFYSLQLAATTYLVISIKHPPAPGYAIGLLAVLAAAMSIHTEMRGWHKAVWMLLIGGCLFMEFRAIRNDRAEHDKEVQEARRVENERFEAIAQGIERSITNSQKQFDTTMARTNRVLNNVTGGNSYAVVFPDTFGQDKELPMLIENRGSDVLTGVSVMITWQGAYAGKVPQFILNAIDNRIIIGTIGPEERQWTNKTLLTNSLVEIEERGEKFRRAYILIYAQNFSVQEFLDLKKKDGKWIFRYSVYRNLSRVEREAVIKSKGKILPKTELEKIDWTDRFDDLAAPHK